MTQPVKIVVFAIVAAIQGCSDTTTPPAKSQPKVEPTIVNASAAQTSSLTLGIPESVAGLPFSVGGKCALDAVNSERGPKPISVSARTPFSVYGWAFDDTTSESQISPIVLLQLVRNSSYYHAAMARNDERGDVAKAFSNPALSGSGFSANASAEGLPPGEYDVLILQRTAKMNLICPTYRSIRVTE